MKLKKIIAVIFAAVLLCLTFSGCWDYRSLDELTIVAGIAVDKGKIYPDGFTVTLEVVEASATDKSAVKSTMLEVEGSTIFQAIYNASGKLYNRVYFGNTDILVISEEVAREHGLNKVIGAFLRDTSIRDTISVLISREKTASEIITPQDGEEIIASYNISNIINQSTDSLNTARVLNLVRVYSKLSVGTDNIALPAFGFSQDGDGEKMPETKGAAVFTGDKLTGFIDDSDVPYLLFVTEKIHSGAYSFFLQEEQYATLSIHSSRPKIDFAYNGDKLNLYVDVKLSASAVELSPNYTAFGGDGISQLEQRAAEALNSGISEMIRDMQKNYKADLFGFDDAVYRNNPALWEKVKNNWREEFAAADIIVNSDFKIKNTGFIGNYNEAI